MTARALPTLLGLALVASLSACAPKAPLDRSLAPAPLPAGTFVPPAPVEATLSNGVRVVLVENHEVPLVYGRLVFLANGSSDPVGKEGLASVTMDMLDEGAAGKDAAALAGTLQKLGAGLGTSAGDDGATIAFSTLARNLDATLGVLVDVLQRPDFPAADWELLRKKRIAGLARARKDPDSVAARVYERILLGDSYRGRLTSEASYGAITLDDMRGWWKTNVVPDGAVLLVGGDTTLSALVPVLEARLAGWKGAGVTPARPVAKPLPATPAIHFVDRPGAAQSVIRVGGYVTAPTDAAWYPLVLANQVVGGPFTARINMNLREDKGWTYGARSGFAYDFAGGRFTASAGVRTDVTAPAVQEIWKEVREAATTRPLGATEFEDGRAGLLQGRPLQFENPEWRLGQEEARWRYALPADWVTGYAPNVQAVTLARAQEAWNTVLASAPLVTLVVGDGAQVRASLASLGLPVIEHDPDGNVISSTAAPTKE